MKNSAIGISFCIVSLIFLQGCLVHPAPFQDGKYVTHDGKIFKTALETDKYYINKISKIQQTKNPPNQYNEKDIVYKPRPPIANVLGDSSKVLEGCIKGTLGVLEEIYWSISPYITNDSGWEFPYDAKKSRAVSKEWREEKKFKQQNDEKEWKEYDSKSDENYWRLVSWEVWAKWRGIYVDKPKKTKKLVVYR